MAVYEINTNPAINAHSENPRDEFFQAFNDTIAGVVEGVCRLDSKPGPTVKVCTLTELKKRVKKNAEGDPSTTKAVADTA
jgi:hypothetical protein